MYKVVLIDDEILTLNGIRQTFEWSKYGFEVINCFTDSLDALAYVELERPDVIFTDVEMPGMSGIEFMKRLREKNIRSKIVIISAHPDFSYAQAAISYGVCEYLVKPISRSCADYLLSKLKHSLDYHTDTMFGVFDDKLNSINNENFKSLINYINNHYNEKLTLSSLAEDFHMNSTYCCKLFTKYYNCSFTEYLRNLRMEKACTLLKQDMTISDVAEKVGYSDYFHFSKLFKKVYGITPYKFKTLNR